VAAVRYRNFEVAARRPADGRFAVDQAESSRGRDDRDRAGTTRAGLALDAALEGALVDEGGTVTTSVVDDARGFTFAPSGNTSA